MKFTARITLFGNAITVKGEIKTILDDMANVVASTFSIDEVLSGGVPQGGLRHDQPQYGKFAGTMARKFGEFVNIPDGQVGRMNSSEFRALFAHRITHFGGEVDFGEDQESVLYGRLVPL